MDNLKKSITGTGLYNDMPSEVKYFSEFTLTEETILPCTSPEIESLISFMVLPEIISTKLIETPIAVSNEGQKLSGHKLVEVKLKEKIKYVSKKCDQSVHAVSFEDIVKSVFVVVPGEIDGKRLCDLMRKKRVIVNAYVEDSFLLIKSPKTVLQNIVVLVNVTFFS